MRTIRYGITVIGLLLTLFLFTACAAQAPTEGPVQENSQNLSTATPHNEPLVTNAGTGPDKEYCRVTVRGEVRLGTNDESYIYNESVHDLLVKENPIDVE